jgi:type 1 fimbria pilin
MSIKNGAFLALFVSIATPAATLIQNMPAVTLQNIAGLQNGTLLKTLPLTSLAASALSEMELSVETEEAMWDTSKSIFKTNVPGIGLSLCDQDNNRCISRLSPWLPGESLFLRLYKIGDLHGGRYSLPSLSIHGKIHPLLRINPPALVINTSLCGVTAQRITVTFPTFSLKKEGDDLPNATFKIPVVCMNPNDYGKLDIQFSFHDNLIDSHTLPTQLENIGIQIDDAQGMPVEFNTSFRPAASSIAYRARLIRLRPSGPFHYGKFSADATVLITLK